MNSSSDARNPVELLAEEFLDRKRRGEQPTLREYLERELEVNVGLKVDFVSPDYGWLRGKNR